MVGRIPQEPGFSNSKVRRTEDLSVSSRDDDGSNCSISQISPVSWPQALDFTKLKSDTNICTKEYNAIIKQHIEEMTKAALQITNANQTPMELISRRITKHGVDIQAEKCKVLGVDIPHLECVRHTAEFEMNAEKVFDTYVRLNYTEAIDAYTYLVEQLEEIDTSSNNEQNGWSHVVYTADKIIPGFAHREFVTLDFVDTENLLLVSRSCQHPQRPLTKVPKLRHCIRGMFTKKPPKRKLRSPLCYFLHVVPLSENKCRVVQFQYSDMGGIILPKEQTKAVIKFGIDNIDRFYHLLNKVQRKELDVGPNTKDYLANPLQNGWNQSVGHMIKGL